jgi:hypothetical protein
MLIPVRVRHPESIQLVLTDLDSLAIGKLHPLAEVYFEENQDQTLCEKEDVCVICIETITYQRNRRVLSCGHTFHKMCVLRWLKTKKSCPTCRLDIVDA